VVEPSEMGAQPLWQTDTWQGSRVIPLRQERRSTRRTGE
jgi:hypothetical protein